MKRFILFNSPLFREATEEKEEYLSPIGLGYIATCLERSGIEVLLIDCVKERKGVSDIIQLINDVCPDYVGINVFSQNYDIVKDILEGITAEVECFIGGQVVKSIYHEILSWDVRNRLNIIIGEGELIIPQIALGKCEEVPILNEDNKMVYKVDMNSIYYPKDISGISVDRKYLKNEIIVNHYGEKEAAIITSRGCCYDCAFCGGARSLNQDVHIRYRTEESIIQEIQEILNLYPNTKSIRILDDLFLRNKKSIDMASRIFANFPLLSWRAMVHVLSLVESIDEVKVLKENGCRELFMGIESGSEKIRKKINKNGSIYDIIQVAKGILTNGIDLKGYFIYGFPEETKEDFEYTYRLAYELKEISKNTPGTFRTSVFQFRPYHGTQLYKEIKQREGVMQPCRFNTSISEFKGRNQFNFDFGNYSLETNNLLHDYIIKTQKLAEDKL